MPLPILTNAVYSKLMKKQTRIVGIDYGLARIGIAVSDPTKMIASPFFTLQADRKVDQTAAKLLKELQRLQEEKECEVVTIVIGMPLKMNGKVGLQADEVKAFAAELAKITEIPLVFWDERLTSVQAERAMREAEMSRKKRAKVVDNVAATIILQSYLDSIPKPEGEM